MLGQFTPQRLLIAARGAHKLSRGSAVTVSTYRGSTTGSESFSVGEFSHCSKQDIRHSSRGGCELFRDNYPLRYETCLCLLQRGMTASIYPKPSMMKRSEIGNARDASIRAKRGVAAYPMMCARCTETFPVPHHHADQSTLPRNTPPRNP